MLLVEDNQLNAEIAAELLRMGGLTVDCAWDGYDATRAIRSSARDYCKRVPIVAMTANAFAEDVQAAEFDDAFPELDVRTASRHVGGDGHLAVLRRYQGGGDA